ncbi:DUF4054 domain-containing protein [Azorhizobium caulinodans]|uniref:DUF4054 domain-containing protein n=1 Tax=Azorhizobium caulinodans TaxID=7 RepID=UPI002FBEFEEC
MTVTVSSFRTDFPAFANTTTYPDAAVTFWLNLSANLLSVDKWGNLFDYGTELFIAHNLVLEAQANKASAAGGVPGVASGLTSSEAVDKVSVSYDTASAAVEGAGNWNLTTYGQRYIQLARLVGAGGLQL